MLVYCYVLITSICISSVFFFFFCILQGKANEITLNNSWSLLKNTLNRTSLSSSLILIYRFNSWAFVLSPLHLSPRHFSQNLKASLLSSAGFLPSKDAAGLSSSFKVTATLAAIFLKLFFFFNFAHTNNYNTLHYIYNSLQVTVIVYKKRNT